MFEIYARHAGRYHELVSAEDYQGNLAALLRTLVDWDGARVLEAGVGTGRVTSIYIDVAADVTCCDQSAHMLEFAAARFAAARVGGAQSRAAVRFLTADNLDLPDLPEKVHVFVEGWSFGHSVADLSETGAVDQTVDALVRNATKNLAPGGTAILIETLGTNTTVPQAPLANLQRMYERLEGEHAFTRHEIRTDFRFPSLDTAADTMGFFFGDEMGRTIRSAVRDGRHGDAPDSSDSPAGAGAAGLTPVIVPEWTGVWKKRLAA
jgi:SAM-dependent methyltransferase